jgi:hypothetical protein
MRISSIKIRKREKQKLINKYFIILYIYIAIYIYEFLSNKLYVYVCMCTQFKLIYIVL